MTGGASAPRVDFYVLETSDDAARLRYACRLIEKAYLQQQTVYVHAGSPAEAAAIDDLLWTFADRSFVPHAPAGTDAEVTVEIGCEAPRPARVLVQLADTPPGSCALYERIAEFVDADPVRREHGRRRFAWYRDQGLRAETHRVGADAQRG